MLSMTWDSHIGTDIQSSSATTHPKILLFLVYISTDLDLEPRKWGGGSSSSGVVAANAFVLDQEEILHAFEALMNKKEELVESWCLFSSS